MIVVKVELWSAITGDVTELARMEICNDGKSLNPRVSDYTVRTLRGRSKEALDKRVTQHIGGVVGHRRLDLHVWHLVAKALASVGYGDIK